MFEIPARIIKGVTVSASGMLADYPASGYDLTVEFVTDGHHFQITATKSGDTFTITIPKATSAAMAVGRYNWQAFIEDIGGTVRYVVGEGSLVCAADFAEMTGGMDARSVLEQTVEAMRTVIAGTATNDQKKVKYADREIERYDRAELITIYKFLKAELKAEQRAEAVARGKQFGGRVRVRFNGMV